VCAHRMTIFAVARAVHDEAGRLQPSGQPRGNVIVVLDQQNANSESPRSNPMGPKPPT